MFEQFPYANFHEMNMDWIIKVVKDLLNKIDNLEQLIADGETSITELTESGLHELIDKKTELEALLQQWYDTHSRDIANELLQAVNSFRTTAHEIGVDVIDSIPDDYTALANKVDVNRFNIKQFNRYDATSKIKNTAPQTVVGVSMYITSDNIIKLSGVSNADGFINIVNTAIAGTEIETGKDYYASYEINRLPNSAIQIYTSTDNGSNFTFYKNIYPFRPSIINFANGVTNIIIRVAISNNVNYNNTNIIFGLLTHNPIVDNKTIYIEPNESYSPSTLITTIANLIQSGYNIHFKKGTYTLNSQLTLIDGTVIEGDGYDTVLNFTGTGNFIYNATGNIIIRNITLQGTLQDRPDTYFPTNSQTGIYLTYEHGKPITIENVQVFGFTKNGIASDNLGYSNTRGLNIVNCNILACGAGISLGQQAEYNNITNCNFRANYYGAINNAGNNRFVNCGFNNNVIGFFMQHTYNDAHSCASNCSFNHNATHAIQTSGLSGAFVFNACTVFLSHSEGEPNDILIYSSKGIIFNACLFGRNTGIAINNETGTGLTLFTSCMFENAPAFTKINNPDIILSNCYTNTGDIITA